MQCVQGRGNWKGQRTFSALLTQSPRNPTLLISEIWAICVLSRLVEASVAKSEPEDASVVRFVGEVLCLPAFTLRHRYSVGASLVLALNIGHANWGDHKRTLLRKISKSDLTPGWRMAGTSKLSLIDWRGKAKVRVPVRSERPLALHLPIVAACSPL